MLYGFSDRGGTLVVCPSISFPAEALRKIVGIQHYEERLLFFVLLLRDPRLRLVYITSVAIDEAIVDYYLSFLPDPEGARDRLELIAVGDDAPSALSAKVLDRPWLIQRLRESTSGSDDAFLVPFNVTSWESELAEYLDIPLFGPQPGLNPLGSKSGSRRVARLAGVPVFDGAEDLWSLDEVEQAAKELLARHPAAGAIVVKLNNGFSGQGNAIVDAHRIRSPIATSETVFCAEEESWSSFAAKVVAEGAIVEELARKPGAVSPSVQMTIAPGGRMEIVSTHDQILGGPDGQVYLGCRFPARPPYRFLIQDNACNVARILASKGVIGSFGVDFIVWEQDGRHRANLTEINLRMGGTTHPYLMTKLATEGRYDAPSGELIAAGRSKAYVATDNLKSDAFVGLTPGDVIDAVAGKGLGYDHDLRKGVTLHLLGALERFGKMGITCIADSPEEADALYEEVVAALAELATSRT
ncbi:MAG: peptide ligase PGM1-related protein [Actinomycetota bacterium]